MDLITWAPAPPLPTRVASGRQVAASLPRASRVGAA